MRAAAAQDPHGGLHRQLKDTVYLRLQEEIVSGVLAPGTLLREIELAARFEVSKTPLRDALARLQKDGLVTIPPYRSAVVSGYSRRDLREIYELRELLEGACARQAAQYIDADALDELSDVVRQSGSCAAGGAVIAGEEDRLAANLDRFDEIMYAHSRNGRIDEMLANIRNHLIRIGWLTTRIPGRLARSVDEHQAIYEAIVRRDPDAAERLMRRHIFSVLADQLIDVDEMATSTTGHRADRPTSAGDAPTPTQKARP